MGRNILVNVGEQRFDRLREEKKLYIDKTDFIREWWENSSTVTLITRPRRFGKTLNMSMLECFFSNRYEGRSDLFEGLSIWDEEKYRELQGSFPVIFLSFANIKAKEYKKMKNKITEVIFQLYEQNRYLLGSGLLSEKEKEYYESIRIGMEDAMAEGAIHFMADFMKRYYDKDVIIIYNPWSIASFIDNGGEYDTYWADTSGNGLVNSLIRQGNIAVKSTMEDLLAGGTLTTELNEQIVFNQLDGSTGAVWSLLLATGYLKVVKLERVGEFKKKVYTLKLTNMEVASMFEDMVKGWFGGEGEAAYNDFIKALLLNDVDAMNDFMNEIALLSFSSFDTAKSASLKDAPERFYHGFVLGLMVELDGRFEITSNRESGFGCYDIMLIPKDKGKDCAYIIEFKVHKPMKEKDLAETVANALKQIEERMYEAKLTAMGFAPENIRKYGFAFKGKECLIG